MISKNQKRQPVSSAASYDEKFARLNRDMRWEVADLLREKNLGATNSASPLVVPRNTFYVRFTKRSIDIVAASLALLVTAPVNLVVAAITTVTLGMPLFFKQQRLGRDGELFTLVKFRNMREGFDENGHPLPGHLRVTKLGKLMRRTSLDELLNFWSILKGDMSLIGPRPLVPEYGPRYSDRHRQRMAVRPGLECPSRDDDHPITNYQEQFEHDVWYVTNVSLKTDMLLVGRLVHAVFNRTQSKTRSTAQKGSFMGYDDHGLAVGSRAVPIWALDEVLDRHDRLVHVAAERHVD